MSTEHLVLTDSVDGKYTLEVATGSAGVVLTIANGTRLLRFWLKAEDLSRLCELLGTLKNTEDTPRGT